MVRNPYADAFASSALTQIKKLPPRTAPAKVVPSAVSEFFGAMDIPHGGNRAKTCTALAHRMSKADLEEAIRRLLADRQQLLEHMIALEAPEVIINNQRLKYKNELRILQRVLEKR